MCFLAAEFEISTTSCFVFSPSIFIQDLRLGREDGPKPISCKTLEEKMKLSLHPVPWRGAAERHFSLRPPK